MTWWQRVKQYFILDQRPSDAEIIASLNKEIVNSSPRSDQHYTKVVPINGTFVCVIREFSSSGATLDLIFISKDGKAHDIYCNCVKDALPDGAIPKETMKYLDHLQGIDEDEED